MKTTSIMLFIAYASVAAARLHAQGTVRLNNYDSGVGIYWRSGSGWAPAPAGTFVEVFGGPSPAALSPLTNSNWGTTYYTIEASGVGKPWPEGGSYFDAGYASVPRVASLGTAWFQIRAWVPITSAPVWDPSLPTGLTPIWSQQVGTADSPPGQFGQPVPLNIPEPIFITIPEPNAFGLLAIGGLLLGRRCFHRER